VVVDLMVRPPVAGEPSYDLYHQETTGIFESLKRRALRLTEAFNKLVRTHTRPLDARDTRHRTRTRALCRTTHAPPHTHMLTLLRVQEGVTCNEAEGAMYLFPRVRLPAKAVQEAIKQKKTPDSFYCLALLDQTGMHTHTRHAHAHAHNTLIAYSCVSHHFAGICVVPGSGFGQKDGTYHFRTTFLPPEDKVRQPPKTAQLFLFDGRTTHLLLLLQIDAVAKSIAKFHQDFMQKYRD
jgi:alanine transaminase